MHLYKKTYKYMNTKTNKIESFSAYNFLEHLRDGISYIPYTQPKSVTILELYSKITYKLINRDTKISMILTPSYNQEMFLFNYEWANTIIVKSAARSWVKSDSGWVKEAYEQVKKISRRGRSQEEIDTAIGNEMEKYLLNKKKLSL